MRCIFPLQACHVCVGMGRKPCKDCAGAGNVSNVHSGELRNRVSRSSSDHVASLLAPDRKSAGCATGRVIATETIDATTAAAEAGRSKSRKKPKSRFISCAV